MHLTIGKYTQIYIKRNAQNNYCNNNKKKMNLNIRATLDKFIYKYKIIGS